jgi:SAM-dependent methyltransferase
MTTPAPGSDPEHDGATALVAGEHLQPADPLWDHLACPHCGGPLARRGDGAACGLCGTAFPLSSEGTLDLRLQRPKTVEQTVVLGDRYAFPDFPFETTPAPRNPAFDLGSIELSRRLPKDLASHIPAADGSDSLALDLGCGRGLHREVCEAAGYRWVGLDVDSNAATVLGDAQALPFADDTFECILSLKVLGQVQNPFVAFSEARRVLEPGGTFVGNVSANEPFFGSNTFHLTPLGLDEALRQGGFETERIFPGWDAFTAQALLGRFPLMPRPVSRRLVAPLTYASRLWYALGSLVVDHEKTSEEFRRFNAAAELHFVAHALADEDAPAGTTDPVAVPSPTPD